MESTTPNPDAVTSVGLDSTIPAVSSPSTSQPSLIGSVGLSVLSATSAPTSSSQTLGGLGMHAEFNSASSQSFPSSLHSQSSAVNAVGLAVVFPPSDNNPDRLRVETTFIPLDENEAGGEITVWNTSSFGNAHQAQMKGDQKRRINQLYGQIKNLMAAKLDHEVSQLTIHSDKEIYTYVDEATGEVHTEDLIALKETHSDLKQLLIQLDKVVDEVHGVSHLRKPTFSSTSKGNLQGVRALAKGTKKLQSLPDTFKDCSDKFMAPIFKHLHPLNHANHPTAPADRKVTLKRLASLEIVQKETLSKMRTLYDAWMQEYTRALAAAPRAPETRALKRDLGQLSRDITQFQSLDTFALSWAVSLYPLDSSDSAAIINRANDATSMVSSFIKNYNNRLFDAATLYKEEAEYAADVGALLLQNRWDYYDHCVENGILMKQEGLADILLREMVFLNQDTTNYDNENLAEVLGCSSYSAGRIASVKTAFGEAVDQVKTVLGSVDSRLPPTFDTLGEKEAIAAFRVAAGLTPPPPVPNNT